MALTSLVAWILLASLEVLIPAAATSIAISAPAGVPHNVSDVVLHSFQSWACAVHSWPDYAGNLSVPNAFSHTLIWIIANKTGSPPHFRVGGTSGDRTTFHKKQKAAIKYDTLPGTQIPENVTIGPSYYESFKTFANLGTKYTYMVNLALNTSGHIENALAEASHAVGSIGSNLESIEIGNEVDLYVSQSVRPPTWTEKDYVREWQAIANPITERILQGNNASIDPRWIYQAFAFSSGQPQDNFSIAKGFNEGIDKNHNIKSVSIHSYMTGYTPETTLQGSFMNHTAIVDNVTSWLPSKNYLAEHEPQVPLYIAEANSDSVTNTLPITYGLQSVFGNALWKVDILMCAMSRSIPRYYVQQGTGFAFDSWQPVYINGTIPPRVLPPWYGDVFVADVVGTSPDVQVYNIDLDSSFLSAYAVYVSGALEKYVVVNLEEWNTTTPYSRPHKTITLSTPDYVTTANVKYLTGPGASSMTDIEWAGQSWNYSAALPGQVEVRGSLTSTQALPKDGVVQVAINASEAMLVTLNRVELLLQR